MLMQLRAYREVESETLEALTSAESVGGYFNQNIKGDYNCR